MARKLENKRRRSLDDNDDDDDDGEWEAHISRRVDLTRPKSVTNAHGPASRTRSSKKIKLDEVASIQGGEVSRLEDYRAHIGDLRSNFASKSWIPEKQVLELILDILQRRDTHEIFGEPVDPEEVEDYYEIIKEPMDFGTMRAKLHEGLYKSLEQFEKDIFLITRNAMHFNSSGTIYFRQARVLNELATEVFRVLRSRPESFQSEFSDSRRRNARRSLVDSRNSLQRACAKAARSVKPSNGIVIDESSKSMSCSVGSYLNIRRTNPSKQGYFGPTVCANARDHKVPFSGRRDDRRLIPTEAERRYTYRPWLSSFNEDESISNKKQLEHVIQKDIGYSQSLMLFVKDLGPVVQSFARNKLSKSFPFSATNHYDFHDSAITGPKSHNFIDHILRTSANKRTGFEDSFKSESFLINAPSIKREISSVTIGDQTCQDQSGEILSPSSLLARAADLSTVRVGVKSVGNSLAVVVDRGLEIGFWHRHCNSSEPKSRKVNAFLHLREDDQFKVEATTMAVDRCKPSSSNFLFEFPFIESRLSQTNAFERLALLQRSSGSEVNFYSALE